jgi:hypothetical protein
MLEINKVMGVEPPQYIPTNSTIYRMPMYGRTSYFSDKNKIHKV